MDLKPVVLHLSEHMTMTVLISVKNIMLINKF